MAEKKIKADKALKDFGDEIVTQVNKGKNPELVFTLRGLSNIIFDQKARSLRLGDKTASRAFFNVAHTKKFLQTVEVASISKNLIKEEKHASLRDAFYQIKRTLPGTKINIVDEQTESDKAIEDLEVITGVSREQLHFNANKNGSIAGKVVILDKGDTIDWSKLGSGGWSIPSNVEDITFKKVNAKYILYMEKAAVWERLHEDKYWDKQNCIIVSSQGQTTRGIRRLLQRLSEEFNLPIYVLCDWDIYGAYIYSVIKYGSIALAHLGSKMTIPSVKYIGITGDDVIKYDLKKHLIKLDEKDTSRIKQVANYEWFKGNKDWQRQFKMFKELGGKVEIQALSARGISFISDKYLPDKIKNKEYLE
ncbi:MAG: DNA topoisomerase IV subunit A [Candidatus Nanoarchaeia archaeon]|nr:DNA topoisomerase IV subunit A [Candidatus Nanoarchaeia archaeon]MDD5587756.1 DNA topoisomerase IV subunit A [Candidatus Nanoarchaeia archaeon]